MVVSSSRPDDSKTNTDTEGLSTGAKAGTAIGAILLTLAIVAVVFLALRWQRKAHKRQKKEVTSTGDAATDGKAEMEDKPKEIEELAGGMESNCHELDEQRSRGELFVDYGAVEREERTEVDRKDGVGSGGSREHCLSCPGRNLGMVGRIGRKRVGEL